LQVRNMRCGLSMNDSTTAQLRVLVPFHICQTQFVRLCIVADQSEGVEAAKYSLVDRRRLRRWSLECGALALCAARAIA
jgi:hypothetical protein